MIQNLKGLKCALEAHFNEIFVNFPGKPNRKGFYELKRKNKNLDDSRYWMIFKKGELEDYAIAGDFDNNAYKKFPITFEGDWKTKFPTPQDYALKKKAFQDKVSKILINKGFNDYLREFRHLPPVCYEFSNTLFVPYRKGNEIKAVLRIDEKGKKKLIEGSEPANTFITLRKPTQKPDLVYIAEGIRSAYAVLNLAPPTSGVVSVGPISNLLNAVEFMIEKKFHPVICAEKTGYEKYKNIKYKTGCYMIGSHAHSDFYDFYKDVGEDVAKQALTSFQENNFIPIGIDDAGRVVCYIRALKNVYSYRKGEDRELFMDTHDEKKLPEKQIIEKFYWQTRLICRKAGPVRSYQKVKEGVFPYKGLLYYHDTTNLYRIKEKSIVKQDALSLISSDLILCKEKNYSFPDLEKVEPLNNKEIEDLLSYLSLFKMPQVHRKLLAGWIIQSSICGGLPYRAPLWIIAPTGTGKTQLTSRLIKKFFIFYERKTGRQTTPKWIHRSFNGKAIPLQRDEYDPSKRHSADTEDEMECVRTTSTERFPQRGISAGIDDSVQEFSYCFSPLYTSTKKPKELSDADLARFVFLKLERDFGQNYNKKIKNFEKMMSKRYVSRFLKSCLLSIFSISETYEKDMSSPHWVRAGHRKSSLLMLKACYNQFFEGGITDEEIEPFFKSYNTISDSRILIEALNCVLKKQNYNILESKSLFNILLRVEKEENFEMEGFLDTFKENGIFFYKKMLIFHKKRAMLFLRKLFKENGETIKTQTLLTELANDGKFFIGERRLSTEKVVKGYYLCFSWTLIKAELGHGEEQ